MNVFVLQLNKAYSHLHGNPNIRPYQNNEQQTDLPSLPEGVVGTSNTGGAHSVGIISKKSEKVWNSSSSQGAILEKVLDERVSLTSSLSTYKRHVKNAGSEQMET